jgi:hypothetical protein
LSSDEDEVGLVGREGVVAEGAGVALFAVFGSEFFPGRWLVVEAADQEVLHDARFGVEPSMEIDISSLDAGGEVGTWLEVLRKLEFKPA